jgi:hypothetical protein
VLSTYQPRYPNMAVRNATEISQNLPDMNPFGIPPWLPDYSTLSTDHDTRYHQMVSQVHAMHGVIAWNHPFGYDMGPLLSATDQAAKRRQVFQSMQAVNAFEVDIVEVGYNVRGQVNAATHIALWDTFSRAGRWLTGNGASDDHGGQGWKSITNGWFTGLWTPSLSDADLVKTLASGRAFAAHLGRWPGGEMDMLVDGTVPMGAISVSTRTSRQVAIAAKNLPTGSTVQLVGGYVDYLGKVDPETWVSKTLSPSAFAAGPVTVTVDTSASKFFRPQVVGSDGLVIGTGNPVWLLRTAPPGGIPPARAA